MPSRNPTPALSPDPAAPVELPAIGGSRTLEELEAIGRALLAKTQPSAAPAPAPQSETPEPESEE